MRARRLWQVWRRRAHWTLRVALGCVGVAVLLFTGPSGCRPPASTKPNVLLLSIDTLRADHLGAYGSTIGASPWMDRLASSGVVMEQAVASAPETAPAVATMLTGLYPDRHAVGYNRLSAPDEDVMLAERLRENGYATAAFVANRIVDSAHGFGQGFDHFEAADPDPTLIFSTDDRTVASALDWLRQSPRDKPWFVWVHLLDPHGPYVSAPEWWSRGFKYDASRFEGETDVEASASNFGLGIIPKYQYIDGVRRLSSYVRRYDGEIRFTDVQVGALYGGIGLLGDLDDTLIVFTADHGESLTEHSEFLQHGWFVYDTTVRVPLSFSWPRRFAGARRVPEQVCAVDIVPTMLDLLGIKAPPSDFDGSSFAPSLLAGARAASATAATRSAGNRECYCVGPRSNHPFALRTGGYKAILYPAGGAADPSGEGSNGDKATVPRTTEDRWELYDVEEDPAELRDLSSKRPDLLEDMEGKLGSFRARFRSNGWRW